MNQHLKLVLLALGLGGGIAVLTGVFLLTVSLDMRHMSLWTIGLTFTAAYWAGRKDYIKLWAYTVLSVIPFAIFLKLVILSDLPSMWFMIPLVLLISAMGFITSRFSIRLRKVSAFAGLLLSMVFSLLYIPTLISGDLTQTYNTRAEAFSFTGPDGSPLSSEDLKGRVVVLDFYGTWCKPCIAELPELARVRDHFSSNSQVVFFIVNSDQGGDTQEKASRFIDKYGNGFSFGYDHDRQTYKAIGLSGAGVPSLVILDQQGNVRLKHVGYNKAETDFVDNIITAINGILEMG